MLDDLADEAMRAGVVIHTFTLDNDVFDDGFDYGQMGTVFRKDLPLSARLEGAFLKDSPFGQQKAGIGKASELLKAFLSLILYSSKRTLAKT